MQQINLGAGIALQHSDSGIRFSAGGGAVQLLRRSGKFQREPQLDRPAKLAIGAAERTSPELSNRDARDLVALAVSGSYLQFSRFDGAHPDRQCADPDGPSGVPASRGPNRSGLNARIDVNRSQVELQTQQQRLTSLVNDFEKQKITLARLIGLPMAQAFTLADSIPYHELPAPDVNGLIQQALTGRADVQAAAAQMKAAELARSAAVAKYYPSVDVTANYGASGVNPSRDAHGVFLVNGAVNFPIFRSGRIQADIAQSDAALAQRKAEYEDAKGQAEQDVRNAALDLAAASQQVRVAQSNRGLAAETLQQAQDRFRAGVADTIEVVQAQESVATAEQDYISALYALNLARVSLGRAVGQTEQGIVRLVEGR